MSALTVLGARAIDAVRIHRITQAEDRIIKHRRLGMGVIIALGNVFLKLSNSRILMFARASDWRLWELHSFELVNGDAHECGSMGSSTIWTGRVPGRSLLEHQLEGTLAPSMFAAAGQELARAHSLHSKGLEGPWSHGDPHLANVLINDERARLIDFETIHEPGQAPVDRHADDLLVLLLDLLGRVDEATLIPCAKACLQAYDKPKVQAALCARLVPPSGLELMLWHTRTHFCPAPELKRRISALREALS